MVKDKEVIRSNKELFVKIDLRITVSGAFYSRSQAEDLQNCIGTVVRLKFEKKFPLQKVKVV